MKQDTLALICWANVAGQFATFMNERFRGTNFSWDNFDGEMAAVSIIAMTGVTEKKQKEFVNDVCKEIAAQLKEHAGL